MTCRFPSSSIPRKLQQQQQQHRATLSIIFFLHYKHSCPFSRLETTSSAAFSASTFVPTESLYTADIAAEHCHHNVRETRSLLCVTPSHSSPCTQGKLSPCLSGPVCLTSFSSLPLPLCIPVPQLDQAHPCLRAFVVTVPSAKMFFLRQLQGSLPPFPSRLCSGRPSLITFCP